jgi:hypothetical protein
MITPGDATNTTHAPGHVMLLNAHPHVGETQRTSGNRKEQMLKRERKLIQNQNHGQPF